MMWKQILDGLSLRAIRHRLDKRRLQEELDLHRLYLLTSYFSQKSSPTTLHNHDDLADQLNKTAQHLGIDGLRSEITTHLTQQLHSIASSLHSVLDKQNDAHAATRLSHILEEQNSITTSNNNLDNTNSSTTQWKGLGGSSSITDIDTTTNSNNNNTNHNYTATKLSYHDVATSFMHHHGFSLYTAPSSITHSDAGDGVYIQGQADVGQIVAFYPGIAYSPLHYRNIPGYPLVARNNPYLISRFDGVIVDAKPWVSLVLNNSNMDSMDSSNNNNNNNNTNTTDESMVMLSLLETRHPLAYAHMANHPPQGTLPNVMIASVDCSPNVLPGYLRAYYPTITYTTEMNTEEQSNNNNGSSMFSLSSLFSLNTNTTTTHDNDNSSSSIDTTNTNSTNNNNYVSKMMMSSTMHGLVLVALRPLHNEELFLNYRLNPHTPSGLPSWYHSVDPEEDARRWA